MVLCDLLEASCRPFRKGDTGENAYVPAEALISFIGSKPKTTCKRIQLYFLNYTLYNFLWPNITPSETLDNSEVI